MLVTLERPEWIDFDDSLGRRQGFLLPAEGILPGILQGGELAELLAGSITLDQSYVDGATRVHAREVRGDSLHNPPVFSIDAHVGPRDERSRHLGLQALCFAVTTTGVRGNVAYESVTYRQASDGIGQLIGGYGRASGEDTTPVLTPITDNSELTSVIERAISVLKHSGQD